MNTNLNTFPRNRDEALTMLFLESQNLDNITPEELAQFYAQTLLEIEKTFVNQRNQRDHHDR